MRYLLIALLLCGCYTQKKASEQVNKANDKFPGVVAKLARDKYPCSEVLKPDTAVIWKDTTIFVDCPDNIPSGYYIDTSLTMPSGFYGTSGTLRYDTINSVKVVTLPGKTIRVPVTIPSKTVYIDRWYEDSAKLKLNAIQINDLTVKNAKLENKVDRKETMILWLIFLVIGLSIPYIIRIVKNFIL